MPRQKINKPDYWEDFGGRLSDAEKIASDFFSDAVGISGVRDVPTSQLELSDEASSGEAENVLVRFDSDGFAYVAASDTDGPKSRRSKEIISNPLDVVLQTHKQRMTEWAQDFSEMIARVQEFREVSKLSAIRYVHGGDGRKESPLPSSCDFLADTDLVAKRSLSPALFRIFHEVWFENYGEGAYRVPEVVQIYIQKIVVMGWKQAGLLPFGKYWSRPSPQHKLGEASNLMHAIQEEQRREQQHTTSRARRNLLRRERHKKARNAEITLAVAA